MAARWRAQGAYLVAAGTRAEVLVRQVEFLDAERAALVLLVVDELVLLYAGHGGQLGVGVGVGVAGVTGVTGVAVALDETGERGRAAGGQAAGRGREQEEVVV